MKKYLTKAEEIKLVRKTVVRWYHNCSSFNSAGVTSILANLTEKQISKEFALKLLTTDCQEEDCQEYMKHRYERTAMTFARRYKEAFYYVDSHANMLDFCSSKTPYQIIKDYRKNLLNHWQYEGINIEGKYTTKSSKRINPKVIQWITKRIDTRYNIRSWIYNKFKSGGFNNLSDMRIRYWFLQLLENRDERRGLKKRQKYTVSRDLDKFIYYTGLECRLCKIQRYKYEKYQKKGVFEEKSEDRHAKEVLPDGMFVKQKALVDSLYPEWPAEVREKIQQAFEPIKDCKMIIDTNFKKAYNPMYESHQDTDGDLASNYSCMSGRGDDAQEFYGRIHGCKVVRWENKAGTQVGRCIMYEYKGQRHFIRIYGIFKYHRAMINLLRKEMHENDLFGRYESIPDMRLNTDWDGSESAFYLDGRAYGIAAGNGDDDSEYVVTTHYDDDCKTTDEESIESLINSSCRCCMCEDRIDRDEALWIDGRCYCGYECAAEDGWHDCAYCGKWVNENNDDYIETEDGKIYCCERHARSDGYEQCEECGHWVPETDSDGVVAEGRFFCCDSCAENAGYVKCDECYEWIAYDNCLKIKGSHNNEYYYCNKDCAERDGWEQAENGEWFVPKDRE